MGEIPSQCPNCGAISIRVNAVPPSEHDGEDWRTRAVCEDCDDYAALF